MKTRSLWHLCLIPWLAVSLHAVPLTIVQTGTESTGASATSNGPAGSGTNYFFTPFDSQLGTLESVTLTTLVTATVTSFDRNVFNHSIQYTPGNRLDLFQYIATPGGAGPYIDPPFVGDSGTTMTLAPNEYYTFSSNFTQTLTMTLTNPSVLNGFLSGEYSRITTQATASGNSSFGGLSMTTTHHYTLTYHYTPAAAAVPDAATASNLTLFALFAGLIAMRSRQRHAAA